MHRLVTVGYIGVVAAAGWAVNHASEQRSEQKLRTLENVCTDVGNPGRAVDQLAATTGRVRLLRRQFQPIVDCHRTYFENDGRPVPLRLNQQTLYVYWVAQGVRPVIHADGTVAPK